MVVDLYISKLTYEKSTLEKYSIPSNTLKVFSLPPLFLPRCDKPPNNCNAIIAERRGVPGTQARSPPSSYQNREFHRKGKGILQSPKNLWFYGEEKCYVPKNRSIQSTGMGMTPLIMNCWLRDMASWFKWKRCLGWCCNQEGLNLWNVLRYRFWEVELKKNQYTCIVFKSSFTTMRSCSFSDSGCASVETRHGGSFFTSFLFCPYLQPSFIRSFAQFSRVFLPINQPDYWDPHSGDCLMYQLYMVYRSPFFIPF